VLLFWPVIDGLLGRVGLTQRTRATSR